MVKVKIYTKEYCPYCKRAKMMLSDAGIKYEEIDISQDPDVHEKLKQETGHHTVPKVFIDDEFIGGSDDLAEWLSKHPDVGKEDKKEN